MRILICFYDEKKEHTVRMEDWPEDVDVACLRNVQALETILEPKAYRLIVLIAYGSTIPALWQTSRQHIQCPIIVLTGMTHLTSRSLAELIGTLDVRKPGHKEAASNELFTSSLAYIEENLFDHELSLDKVASSIYMSRCHYSRTFQRYTGKGFKEYVIHKRLKKAHSLLKQGNSVTEVCYTVGYSDLTHFARVFKRKFGMNPSACRPRYERYEGVLA
ncbi:helix-turn-helix transcriptional regulator [Cohnella soli]|uniref:Helix-turn-helix transcriptional regulator n=1 Tax=Cohnella soli TaxID=425005 RepID=A0ABW0I459_9BACL